MRKNINKDNIFEQAFSFLPKVMETKEDFYWLIDTVFGNFIADNVTFLEIRSTPKVIGNNGFVDYL